jgi:hypothetical protein
MFKLKPLPTLTGIVAGAILITNLVHSEPTQQGGPVDTIKAIVHDAKAEGGMIVECRGAKHLCRDLATDKLVGNGRDGYYVVWPNRSDNSATVRKYQTRVRAWLDRQ